MPLPETSATSTPMRVARERQQVVVVAAHLRRGQAERGDAQAGQGHRALGQQAHLDLAGDAQLLLQPLLLRLLAQQVLDARAPSG